MTQSKKAIAIPTYNETENIPQILDAIHKVVPDFDILVIDDSSPDGTAQKVTDYIEAGNSWVSLKVRKNKEGLGAAYIDGFSQLIEQGYETIVQMDADFSHQPHYLVEMLKQREQGAGVVIGSRYVSGGGTKNWSFMRQLISRGGSFYSGTILGLSVNDVTAGYKLWNANTLKKVIAKPMILGGFGFQIEMAYRTKLTTDKVVEIPIIFPDREAGESKMSGKIFKEALFGVWKLRTTKKELLI